MFNKGIFKRRITMNRNWGEKPEGGFFMIFKIKILVLNRNLF